MGIRIAHVSHNVRLCGVETFMARHGRVSGGVVVLYDGGQ